MDYVVALIIIGSAIWVLIDAKKIGVKKGLVKGVPMITGKDNLGPWGWFFAVWIIWPVYFPLYIHYRGKFKLAVSVTSNVGTIEKTNKSESQSFEDLEKLSALKEKGLITVDEFETKKKQILGL